MSLVGKYCDVYPEDNLCLSGGVIYVYPLKAIHLFSRTIHELPLPKAFALHLHAILHSEVEVDHFSPQ